jgi:hypothetical protein
VDWAIVAEERPQRGQTRLLEPQNRNDLRTQHL